jgi:hypothetical protein
MSMESDIKDFIHRVVVRAENKEAHPREIAMALELRQRMEEYYEELQDAVMDGMVSFDELVNVRIDGKAEVRFPNTDKFSEWLNEHI